MKVLILGKHGQLGRCLQDEADRLNIEVSAVGRESLDLSDLSKIPKYFEAQHDFDFVINAAAYTAVDTAEKELELADVVNHLAVREISKACETYNIPFIHVSTDYVFDGASLSAYSEEDVVCPLGVYGASKLAGEEAVRDHVEQHIILRVSWVFSCYGKNFVKTMLHLAETKETLAVVSDQYGSPTSAVSIARVIFEICQAQYQSVDASSRWGTYHYSDFPVTTWHQLAKHTIHSFKAKKGKCLVKTINPITTADYPTPAKRPHNSALNVEKIQQVFGIEQKSWMNEVDHVVDTLLEE